MGNPCSTFLLIKVFLIKGESITEYVIVLQILYFNTTKNFPSRFSLYFRKGRKCGVLYLFQINIFQNLLIITLLF